DILNLLKSNSAPADSETAVRNVISKIEDRTRRMLLWLKAMTHPDGGIALFNDSAFNEAPEPAALEKYYTALTGGSPVLPAANASFKDSGYHVINSGGISAIIDAGPFSPTYLPAHGHCDMLSYELSYNDRRIVIDTGAFDYHDAERRRVSRETSSHNTVRVNGGEQTEIWSKFRAARRAAPLGSSLKETDDATCFTGKCRYVIPRVTVERNIEIGKSGPFDVTDVVTGGAARYTVESFVHFHPSVRAKIESSSQGEAVLKASAGAIVFRVIAKGLKIELKKGKHFPDYDSEDEIYVVCMSGEVKSGESFGYSLVFD
ncbi:MAG TPA: heparinase II/III-family protein, partial [bacterium]|nr:heparinase II/III-family protein [bacterium]